MSVPWLTRAPSCICMTRAPRTRVYTRILSHSHPPSRVSVPPGPHGRSPSLIIRCTRPADLSFSLSRSLSAIYGSSEVTFLIIIPTGWLAHSGTAFILCPSHLRIAGGQPKCRPLDLSAGRAGGPGIVPTQARTAGLGDKTQVHYTQSRRDWLKRSDHRSPRAVPRRFARGRAAVRASSRQERRDPALPWDAFLGKRISSFREPPLANLELVARPRQLYGMPWDRFVSNSWAKLRFHLQ